MSDNASAPAGQVPFMAPVDPETLRAGLGNFARAALAMRRDIELAAEQGDPEARSVLAHEARQKLARWGRPPTSRKRKPPPPGISPRGLSRTEAAAYVGLGSTSFDHMVRIGRLPAPIRVGRRAIWDRGTLDAALATLAGGAPLRPDGTEPNPWDAILGTVP